MLVHRAWRQHQSIRGQLICLSAELSFRGPWTAWRNGLRGTLWNTTRINAKPCTWEGRAPAAVQARTDGERSSSPEKGSSLCLGIQAESKLGISQECALAAKETKAEQPGGWQMCLSSFPRYSDGTGVPDPVLDPQCKKHMDTLEQGQQTPPRGLRARALWGEAEGTGLVWPQKR